jgi:hypothetical protein
MPAVEVDELPERQLAVAHGRVSVELAEESCSGVRHTGQFAEAAADPGNRLVSARGRSGSRDTAGSVARRADIAC